MTGKNEAGQASRLCKRYLFLRFRRLVGRLKPITEALSQEEADRDYGDVKRLNQPYAVCTLTGGEGRGTVGRRGGGGCLVGFCR